MKLFLSSIRLPNTTEQAKLFGNNAKPSVAIIPNAWDTYPKDRQSAELAGTLSQFDALGYRASVFDLVTSSDHQLQAALKSSEFIWFMGGNSFYLNYRVQKSGFDRLLKDALARGLIYGGASAGAVIACPTLHGVENADDPKDAPQTIWDGLGLVKFGIVPHWGMEKYADNLEKVAAEMQPYVPQLVKLTNEQAVTVIDDTWDVS